MHSVTALPSEAIIFEPDKINISDDLVKTNRVEKLSS